MKATVSTRFDDLAAQLARRYEELADEYVRRARVEMPEWTVERPDLADFHWQSGYGAFSVSPGHVESLIRYVATQEEHHRGETFQEEFRRLCMKYGLPIDERYVWD